MKNVRHIFLTNRCRCERVIGVSSFRVEMAQPTTGHCRSPAVTIQSLSVAWDGQHSTWTVGSFGWIICRVADDSRRGDCHRVTLPVEPASTPHPVQQPPSIPEQGVTPLLEDAVSRAGIRTAWPERRVGSKRCSGRPAVQAGFTRRRRRLTCAALRPPAFEASNWHLLARSLDSQLDGRAMLAATDWHSPLQRYEVSRSAHWVTIQLLFTLRH